MAILTKFLQLLKPERNDYVDVEKHLSENYDKIDTKIEELSNSNDKKLDKGAVSSEYDTAKKIEDKIKILQSTADKKLDKGNVLEKYNTAEKIGNEINLKQSKIDNNLKTASKEIVAAINSSISDKGVIQNQQPSYFDTVLTPGYYTLKNSYICDGVYQWGNLIIFGGDTFKTQMYYPHNKQDSVIARNYRTGQGWTPWQIISGHPSHISTLNNVGDTFTIPNLSLYMYRIDLYSESKGISSSVWLTSENTNAFNKIVLYSGEYAEISLKWDPATKTLTLTDKGRSDDGNAEIYAIV